MFSKILIANRGEVAVRIIRSCREMGIESVAVYSVADRDSLHVSLADEAICIGGNAASESYLNMEAILSAAICTGAQAIHPGYGFLAENAKFAELCEQCKITFIGPASKLIATMGDKDAARQAMAAAGVPTVPGTQCIENVEEAAAAAREIGFPLLVKARSGGGGKGIRLVSTEKEFAAAFVAASEEARAAFGDGGVYLEKYLSPTKHIEMQLLCDEYGTALCLGERECSIQRKNQKMIEESPSPAVSPELREKMTAATHAAAKAVGYANAGTIEYLLDTKGNFYFMEMNTRLQVEHPVTEMETGIDIVKWQIRIAAGMRLTMQQEDVRLSGCAIECRINAENPLLGFMPSCGTVSMLHVPGGPQVRFDSAIYQGYSLPIYYDSMVGKLIVHAGKREQAIRKMKAALSELVLEGVDHTGDLLLGILSTDEFVSGTYFTDFMEHHDIAALCKAGGA